MNNEFELDALIKKMAADHQPALPSPDVIWWRAQILKKQAEKARVERPFRIMRLIAVTVCFLFLAGLWMTQRQEVYDVFRGFAAPALVPLLLGAATIAILFGWMWRTVSQN